MNAHPLAQALQPGSALFRSLLQKAIRRGCIDLLYTLCVVLEESGDKAQKWLRERTVLATLAECWPLAARLNPNGPFHSHVAAMIDLAGAPAIRGAVGLGHLARRGLPSDSGILDSPTRARDLKIVAAAIARPDDFWQWLAEKDLTADQRLIFQCCQRYWQSGNVRFRAIVLAAAYLATTCDPIDPPAPAPVAATLDYWVVFDRHTRTGQRVLKETARDLHMPIEKLRWAADYYEWSRANATSPAPWWQRYCQWRFALLEMDPEEAHLLWHPAKAQIKAALTEEALALHGTVYRWKLAHRKRIEQLRQRVALFMGRRQELTVEQSKLFEPTQ